MNIQEYAVPKEDQLAFAKVMAYMVQVDNKVTLEEKHVIDDMVFNWQIDERGINEIYEIMENGASIDFLIQNFKNSKTKYMLIQELITLANIDGSYDEKEKKAVLEIASDLNVSENRVKDIEQWVYDGINWRERGIDLLKEEGV
jgi:tellurite resistance protein